MDNLNASEIEAGFVRFNELMSLLDNKDRENSVKIREISFIASSYAKELARKRYNAERNINGI